MFNNTNVSAFSLVELSIVIVILGLLTGGILTGQSLIRAAELRSVGTEYTNYQTAVQVFRDKYFSLPGDMINATSFWGSAGGDGGNAACTSANEYLGTTCNGDGNGSIDHGNSNSVREFVNFWEHLANAGLIKGKESFGRYPPSFSQSNSSGVHLPNSKLSGNAYWSACYSSHGNPSLGDVNTYVLGSLENSSSTRCGPHTGVISPEEAWVIDVKLDDGIAGSGTITAEDGNDGAWQGCSSDAPSGGWTDVSATYNVNESEDRCVLFFKF